MRLPEGEIWRPMWLFNIMLLAFTNARQAGGLPDPRGSRLGRRRTEKSARLPRPSASTSSRSHFNCAGRLRRQQALPI